MIKQLQKRFIRIALVTLAAAVVLVVGIVNIVDKFERNAIGIAVVY